VLVTAWYADRLFSSNREANVKVTGYWVAVTREDKPNLFIDKHYAINCPHCGAKSNLTAISTPRWGQMERYQPSKVIVGYRCDACNEPVALRFAVHARYADQSAQLSLEYDELERPMETFEYQHLPEAVASDFKEALTCYSQSCLNATAAMCRRTIQSVATNLGAGGTDRVSKQIVEAKDTAGMDDDTFNALKEVMLGGHDGSHPHLPAVSSERAAVLVELMKDVLTQLYLRKAKIQSAMQLRKEAIAAQRVETT
jgi:hypothetical protein